jgi:S1-C subfamily serine protease
VVGVVARSPLQGLLDSLGDSIKFEHLDAGRRMPLASRVGSGIVIDARGHVVTLASVVSGASDVVIVSLLDGRRIEASVTGLDDYSGLAVLQAAVGVESLKPVSFAQSDTVKVGSLVTTLSSPGGDAGGAPVYSVGFVAGLGISPGPVRRGSYIKLNVPSAPGAGGGAVLDTKGRLVGIVFGADAPPAKARGPIRWEAHTPEGQEGATRWKIHVPEEEEPAEPEPVIPPDISIHILEALHRAGVAGGGVSYAVPAGVVRHVSEEILRTGSVKRGWVGVKIEEAEPGEVRLVSVVPGSPAERAGLLPGDRILTYGLGASAEEPLTSSTFLVDSLASASPGTPLRLGLQRDDKRFTISLVLADAPQTPRRRMELNPFPSPPGMRRPILGIDVDQEVDDEARERLGAPPGIGLLVLKVHDESRAEASGMQEGDLLVEALGFPLRTLADLRRALREQGGDEMTVTVIRDRRKVKLEVPPAIAVAPTPQPAPAPPPAPPSRRAPRPRP